MSNHCVSIDRPTAVERRRRVVGKTNLAPDRSCVSVEPSKVAPVSRGSQSNFSPLEPRPWSRTRLCVCLEAGCTTNGCGAEDGSGPR